MDGSELAYPQVFVVEMNNGHVTRWQSYRTRLLKKATSRVLLRRFGCPGRSDRRDRERAANNRDRFMYDDLRIRNARADRRHRKQ